MNEHEFWQERKIAVLEESLKGQQHRIEQLQNTCEMVLNISRKFCDACMKHMDTESNKELFAAIWRIQGMYNFIEEHIL